ncbi:hypothetical protein F8271_25000 [Micromonospora sp. ALFpr18c]|uniref:hypothetical protein n=1 Tax=Micromonospora sp. ALFpr18c TaxID=1458665 RepID=UPI00124BAC6D|nr:hypothetical protein [Micromonospora sp. ALFpr18c]KAB1932929.1 hypothetical protein F8271_25000 [Micromonospora sp. ALFpr18c]
MNEYQLLLLILAGGTGVPASVFLIARHLVERHGEQHGQAYAAQGERQVATAEARRRATQRGKEMAR